MPAIPTDFISPRDLAQRWDRGFDTVKSWCRDGLIPGACKCGIGIKAPWRIPLKWVADAERKTVEQLRAELKEHIRQRKSETWDKHSSDIKQGKQPDYFLKKR